LQTES